MDEMMVNNDLKMFLDAINELLEIKDEDLTDNVMEVTLEQIKARLSPLEIEQAVNQIVNNLEMQSSTREQAKETIDTLKEFINELVYGERVIVGNKKMLVDAVVKATYDIFDKAVEKYHMYAIELPMTVEKEAKVPTYAHETDAAADLYAMETVVVEGNTLGNKIRTGVKIQLPEGWLALILPRSSMGTKTPLRLSNSVGLIDSGYRGELGVLYDNISDTPYTINAGDRIAQLLVMPNYRFKPEVVDILADSDRGETGFGDSGK